MMKFSRYPLFLLFCIGFVVTVTANTDDPELHQSVQAEVAINPGEEHVWNFGQIEPGQKVLLSVDLRRDNERMGGYGWYAQLLFNGETLDASINRRKNRLMNKGLSFHRTNGLEVFWNLGDGVWHTFFAPDFQTNTATYGVKLSEDPYRLILDVTDLIRHDKDNEFVARNLISKSSSHLRDVVVSARLALAGKPEEKQADREFLELASGVELKVLDNGGFALVSGGKEIPFYSTYSFPNGGRNVLGESGLAGAEPEWRVRKSRDSNGKWQVEAAGKYYKIERVLEHEGDRIVVRETLTNLTEGPVGILMSHHLAFGELPFWSCRMAGRKSESLNDVYSPENPTLFFPLHNSGLGMVIEDDILRNQSVMFYDGEKAVSGFENSFFALDAKASYTTQWSVYLIPDEDYFTFINRVREAWGSNITIEAPAYFDNYAHIARMSDPQLESFFSIRNPRYVSFWEVQRRENLLPEWDNRIIFGYGTGILDPVMEEEVQKVKTAVERIHRVTPETKVALYSHCFFVSPEHRDDPRYQDSWIVDEEGERVRSVYNNPQRVDFQPVFPTLSNRYGKDYLKLIDFYLQDLGVDWLYWDESNGPGATHQSVSVNAQITRKSTFNAWDGHSAIINPDTKLVERKFALLPLHTREFFNEVRRRFAEREGLVYFNGSAQTRDRISTPSFVETQYTITDCYRTHLNTPLAYAYGTPTIEDIRQRLFYGCLYARSHINFKSEVIERCYPFTPVELRSGWVKGKERIIAAVSGDYGWDDGEWEATLFQYDREGEMVSVREVERGGENVHVQVLDGGISILERIL